VIAIDSPIRKSRRSLNNKSGASFKAPKPRVSQVEESKAKEKIENFEKEESSADDLI